MTIGCNYIRFTFIPSGNYKEKHIQHIFNAYVKYHTL